METIRVLPVANPNHTVLYCTKTSLYYSCVYFYSIVVLYANCPVWSCLAVWYMHNERNRFDQVYHQQLLESLAYPNTAQSNPIFILFKMQFKCKFLKYKTYVLSVLLVSFPVITNTRMHK
jgi:hypothetical protein